MSKKAKEARKNRLAASKQTTKHRPLHMMLYIVMAVCLCLAWASPLRNIVTRRLWPTPQPGPRDAYEFIALAFTQPSRSPDDENNSRRQASFHEYLDTLVANGYAPITLQDVVHLINRGAPLPRKSVLLTVDLGSKTFLHEISSAVWRYGWHGVAFINTLALSANAENSPTWKDIRKLQKSGQWETGLSGHLAAEGIPAAEAYGRGEFLTSRMWLAAEKRFETAEEFRKRIENDYRYCLEVATSQLDRKPFAYAYPFGNFGQYTRNDTLPRQINLDAVGSRFSLAFTLGDVGRNTMFTDPRRLNRMEVDPEWSGSDLLDAIENENRPIALVDDVDMTRRATGWYLDRGHFDITENGLSLSAAASSGGAALWLGGSDARRDFSATVDFTLKAGTAQFYTRAAADLSTYLLIEIDGNGNATLKQKSMLDNAPVILAENRSTVRSGKQHRLSIYVRDRNINVSIDDLKVFNAQEQPTGVEKAGLFGASVVSTDDPNHAEMNIANLLLQRRRSTLASWDFDAPLDPYAINWIQNNGSRLTEISPPVNRLQWVAENNSYQRQSNVYRRLAGLYNLRLMPCLRISTDEELAAWTPISIAGTLSDIDCDGLYVNFERYDQFKIEDLENWLRRTSKMLSGAGRPVLVRLPRMLERLSAVYSLLAMIPSVEIVTDTNTQIGVDQLNARQIHEEVINKPTQEAMNALPRIYTIDTQPPDAHEQTIEMRLRELIDTGEAAYRHGIYESAIAAFSEWSRLAPQSPIPPRRIGDALSNLGYHDEAAGFYKESLDIAPSQLDLATRYAKLLGDIGRKAEARAILNTYARLFPDSSDILLAQAEWLYRENRTSEAKQRAQRVLLLDPDNFDATLFMLRIADNEVARTEAIEQLMVISKSEEQQYKLVTAIWEHDLLTYQNSHLFIRAMDQIANETNDSRIQELIKRLNPLDMQVSEDFSDAPALSNHWKIEGAEAVVQDGTLIVEATPVRSEFNVRLLRSERWRDSFIEIATTNVTGGFWMYARRSRDHLIRWGFDPGRGRLNLQVWKGRNNEVVASQFVPWAFPENGCTLRLEIRGKGASGLVDGKPVFDVPLPLPDDFGLGWTSFAANSSERGKAKAVIGRIASGPIPVRIALTPGAPADDDNGQQTAYLRELLPVLTDVSPDWFTVDDNGKWHSKINEESNFYDLFARYYRLRLTPVVRVSPQAGITADDLITVCRTHGFDGLVLWFNAMPDEAWFNAMDLDLNTPGLDVIAVANAPQGDIIRGIASSRTLFRKHGEAVPLTRFNASQTGLPPEINQINDAVVFTF